MLSIFLQKNGFVLVMILDTIIVDKMVKMHKYYVFSYIESQILSKCFSEYMCVYVWDTKIEWRLYKVRNNIERVAGEGS